MRASSQGARAYVPVKPHVEHLVQEDVREDGRYDPALRTARLRARQRAVFEYPCIEPLAYQTLHHPIAYPAAQHLAQSLVIDRVEVLADVDLDDPSAGHLARLSMQHVERLLRRASRPE